MAKGRIVAKSAVTKRKKDYFYYVDADGNVRETKRNTKGGKRGRKVCKTAKQAQKAKRKLTKKIKRNAHVGVNSKTGQLKKGYKWLRPGVAVKA